MEKKKPAGSATEPEAKKKGGRKPMTAEEKASAAKARAESKAKADSLKPTVIMQFQGTEVEMDALVEAAAKLDALTGKLQALERNILQYAEKLGLTPSGRVRLAQKRAQAAAEEPDGDLFGD